MIEEGDVFLDGYHFQIKMFEVRRWSLRLEARAKRQWNSSNESGPTIRLKCNSESAVVNDIPWTFFGKASGSTRLLASRSKQSLANPTKGLPKKVHDISLTNIASGSDVRFSISRKGQIDGRQFQALALSTLYFSPRKATQAIQAAHFQFLLYPELKTPNSK